MLATLELSVCIKIQFHLDVSICQWTYQENVGNTFSMPKAQRIRGKKMHVCRTQKRPCLPVQNVANLGLPFGDGWVVTVDLNDKLFKHKLRNITYTNGFGSYCTQLHVNISSCCERRVCPGDHAILMDLSSWLE